ncbi:MAG: TonB family protein [Proteobacteria bacterium]|nr:TonB family protein [Pseudomonadota bacterium]
MKVFFKNLNKYTAKDCGFALLGAILINFTLFTLMPGLIQRVPDRPDLESIESIQVVRVKRPDTDVQKKEKTPPKPEKKEIMKDRKPLTVSRPVKQKIRLPFQLNPKLASGPQTFSVPSLDRISLNAPGINGAYGVNDLDGPLTPLVRIPPMYPIRAKRLGIEGSVNVQFLVNSEGNVAHVEILSAEPEGLFETSVINCVSKWRFKPGTVEGNPVNTWAETTIRFELEAS